VILKKVAMKREQQRDGVIGNVLGPIVRNITNFDSKTSACVNIDDVEANTCSCNHLAVSQSRSDLAAYRIRAGQDRYGISYFVDRPTIEPNRDQLESGIRQEFFFDPEIRVRWVQEIDFLCLHELSISSRFLRRSLHRFTPFFRDLQLTSYQPSAPQGVPNIDRP
jgi:hypothetical protein